MIGAIFQDRSMSSAWPYEDTFLILIVSYRDEPNGRFYGVVDLENQRRGGVWYYVHEDDLADGEYYGLVSLPT